MKQNITQKQQILSYLLQGKKINQWKAYNLFRASRLSAIIYNLKKDGFIIKTERMIGFNESSYVEYSLIIDINLPDFL